MKPSCSRLDPTGPSGHCVVLILLTAAGLLTAPIAASAAAPLHPGAVVLSEIDDAQPSLNPDQDPGPFRIGFNIAGTSLVALVVEHRWGSRAAEVSIGTISLRDISVSVVGKQYFSGGTLRPFVGLGLWSVVAFGEERTGRALIARAPLGLHWNFTGAHAAGAEMNLNRALAVRRTDPEDDTPPNTAIVPIPALYYRYHLR